MLFAVFGLATVVLIVEGMTGSGGFSSPFVLFWLFALGWNAYWWLFRVAYSVTLRDGVLAWEAPLRRGRIATSALRAFRPMKLLPNVIVIKHAGGQPLLVMPGKGIADLAAALRETRPDLDVRVGPAGRMHEWMPGPSAWRRDD